MRVNAKAPAVPVLFPWPVYLGHQWIWLEPVELVFATMAGLPHIHFRAMPVPS